MSLSASERPIESLGAQQPDPLAAPRAVGLACFGAVAVYSVLALRAVYGRSLAATLGKSVAIALLHGVVLFVALAGAALITLLTL